MEKIEIIRNRYIKSLLLKFQRQYLVGNLLMPQELQNINDDNVEVGITYCKKYKVDAAHYHTACTEYQYVIAGKSKYLDLDTKQVYEVKKGDFFVIRPSTKYYQKSVKGTKILFFKFPAGNDKQIVELNEEEIKWGKKYCL